MTVQSLKTSLHELIDLIEDPTLLAAYYKILSAGQSDWSQDLSSSEAQEIKQGIRDVEEGNTFPHAQVMKEVRDLLNLS